MTPDKLKAFFQERQPTADTPLMLDEAYFPEKGTIIMDQVPGGIPVKGATVSPQGKAVTPIQGMQVGAKSVAQPIKPEIKAVADAAPKADYAKVIQEMRDAGASQSSQETVVPQAPVQTGLENIDLKAIREKVGREGESASLSDLLVGLVPVALDAATGGQGFALGGAGEYYTGKAKDIQTRNRTLEDKLMEYQKARAIASAKNKETNKLATASNLVEVVGPDGKVIREWAGKAAGMEVPKKESSALSYEQRIGIEQEKARLKALTDKAKLSKSEEKEKRDLEMTLSQRWEQNKFTQGTRTVVAAASRLAAIDPENASPIDDIGAVFGLMEALDPESVVRESEQAMAIGARSYDDVVNYFGSIASGQRKLTPTQVRNIQKFAQKLSQRRIEEQNKVDSGFLTKAKNYGLNPENVVQRINVSNAIKWKGKTIFFATKEEADAAASVPGAERVK